MFISNYLFNLYWIAPEVWLCLVSVFLLGFGVITLRQGGKIKQQQKFSGFVLLSLVLVFVLFLDEYLVLHSCLGDGYSVSVVVTNSLLGVDPFLLLLKLGATFLTMVIVMFSLDYFLHHRFFSFEFLLLLVLALLGSFLLVGAKNLLSVYLAIELISLSFYVLAASKSNCQLSVEAGLKYFLLGALGSGLLLFGCVLFYLFSGELGFVEISNFFWFADSNMQANLKISAIFIVIALLFKLAASPFHSWAIDVYEGVPLLVTAYFSLVPKVAIFGLLLVLLQGPFYAILDSLQPLIYLSGLASVWVGALGGLGQTKLKRLLAYSAVGHVGFMLVGLGVGSLQGLQASLVYLFVYLIGGCVLFSVLLKRYRGNSNYIVELAGLSRQDPLVAIVVGLSLFSMAGIPPLAGFFSKYFILLSLTASESYLLSLSLILGSVVACFYYLRLVKWVFFKDSASYSYKIWSTIGAGEAIQVHNVRSFKPVESVVLGFGVFFMLTFLSYPGPILQFFFDLVSLVLV